MCNVFMDWHYTIGFKKIHNTIYANLTLKEYKQ